MKISLFSFLSFSHQLDTLFFKICFRNLLCLYMLVMCSSGRGKKKKKGRMFVCEERERGVCSMGAYRRRHGIALTLTPNTAKSLGKAYGYILPHTSALKSDYISLVYLSLQM